MAGVKRNDAYVGDILKRPNMLVPHYLMHSYLYYVEDRPVISDKLYDEICTRLDREWEEIDHPHKHLVDRSALAAGTGYHLTYPDRVVYAARYLRRWLENGLPRRPRQGGLKRAVP